MKKRICTLFIALVLGFCSTKAVYTVCAFSDIDYDNSHLRIFTPYHNLKSVFSSYEMSSDVKDAVYKNNLSKEDIDLIASVVYAESQGEPFEGKIGVASVILNRLSNPLFPKSVKDVIYQRNAFSCVINGHLDIQPDIEAYKAVDEALNGKDPTKEAVFFYNPETASSSWIKNAAKEVTVTIGNHTFFK